MSISNQLLELVLQRDYLAEKAVDFGCTLSESPTIIEIAEALAPSDYGKAYNGSIGIETGLNKQLLELALQRDYLAEVVTHLGFTVGENSTIREITDAITISDVTLPAYVAVYGGIHLVFSRGNSAAATYVANDGNKYNLTEAYYDFQGSTNGDIETVLFDELNQPPWSVYANNIVSVDVVKTIKPSNMAFWFCNMTNCTSMDLALLDTSEINSYKSVFKNCSSLRSLDISNFYGGWDMKDMFYGMDSLEAITLGENFYFDPFSTSSKIAYLPDGEWIAPDGTVYTPQRLSAVYWGAESAGTYIKYVTT